MLTRGPSRLAGFRAAHGFDTDEALSAWALHQPEAFWRAVLEDLVPVWEGSLEPVIAGDEVEHARFFPNLRVSWPAALLHGDPEAPALTSLTEDQAPLRLTRGELRERVARAAAGLATLGLGEGDRVVAVARSHAEAVIACLAVTSLGATWSSVGPDMAADAALSRFRLLEPRLLLAHRGWHQSGRQRDLAPLIDAIAEGLPTLERVLDLGALPSAPPQGEPFPLRPFDHPLFVLFSSGTTGPPKAIVHGHGGTLLEHAKELALHGDLGPGSRLYFHTSTTWMMWPWKLSALAVGAEIVLYDGAVAWPERGSLLERLSEAGVTDFGTSPPYLQYLQDGGISIPPWPELRTILSTGSILYERQYAWAREAFGPIPLQSISGGTDIIGCFVLGHPERAVAAGRCTSISLGYDVRVVPDEGGPERSGTGELVCVAPFPSRPVGLLQGAEAFHRAYFSTHTLDGRPVWTHGDWVELGEDGRARMLGRSDGVLNVRGVRIGPAEIYQVVRELGPFAEAMALDQAWPRAVGGRRLVLLVVMKPGHTLDRPLTLQLKRALKQRRSRDHVPDLVVAVDALPRTLTGKRSERAATDALHGREVRNRAALANPEALDGIAAHPELVAPT